MVMEEELSLHNAAQFSYHPPVLSHMHTSISSRVHMQFSEEVELIYDTDSSRVHMQFAQNGRSITNNSENRHGVVAVKKFGEASDFVGPPFYDANKN